jgi:hypothetical protein
MNNDFYLIIDKPTTCPKCGVRSEIISENEVDTNIFQSHLCLNESCGFDFIVCE